MANKIDYLRMEPADNGVIISYDEYVKAPGAGQYDNIRCKSHKEVFDFDEDGDEDDTDKAMTRFKELFKQCQSTKEMKGSY